MTIGLVIHKLIVMAWQSWGTRNVVNEPILPPLVTTRDVGDCQGKQKRHHTTVRVSVFDDSNTQLNSWIYGCLVKCIHVEVEDLCFTKKKRVDHLVSRI